MEIGNIDELGVYTYREFIETDEEGNTYSEIKKVRIDEDEKLVVGETAYFSETRNNKVKRLNEKEYMFYRFDEVQTHIEDYNSDYTIEDFGNNIVSKLDYDNLDYSMERIGLINELLDKDKGVYDLVSSNRIIQKEQKSSTSPLSEEQRLDRQIEILGSYIIHPRYSDKEEEEYIEGVKEDYQVLKRKKGKTEQEIKEMIELKDELDLFSHGILTRSREQRNKSRENVKNNSINFDSDRVISDISEFNTDISKVEYVGKDLEIDEGYWDRMGFSNEGKIFREEVIEQYEEALDIMSKQLGYGEYDGTVKLGSVEYEDELGRKRILTPQRRMSMLRVMYSELKSDYYTAKEILSTPIHFNSTLIAKQKLDYNFDTYHENEDGKVVEISKNTVLFSNADTYKGLIANYYNLKDKYQDNFMDDMWYILLTFEDLIGQTDLTNEEKFVLDKIMKDYFRKEIVEEFEEIFGKNISMYSISNMVNRTIPNKMRDTYLDSVNTWMYTYKMKGKFKQCSKCSEIKTINNDRYFSRKNDSRDGFWTRCKVCRNNP